MKDKIVWITGGSSGIGEALVYAYSNLGASLIISSRNAAALNKVKANCANPDRVRILPLNLEDTDSLNARAMEAIQIFGAIDLLINSGGISQRSLAMETELITEQRLMTVNFWGTVVLSKAVLKHMLARNSGAIVCISSLVGKFGTKYRSAYAASKHALHGYFDSLRTEVGNKNIHIMLACPGFIKTNITINALTATGAAQGTMDQAQQNGMNPEAFAAQLIKDIAAKKDEVYIGGKETLAVWFKRFFPGIFAKIIKKAKVT